MGESLIRRPLQPEATGAVMELTKWLKPSVWLVTYRGWRECAGCDASERRASMSWWQPYVERPAVQGASQSISPAWTVRSYVRPEARYMAAGLDEIRETRS